MTYARSVIHGRWCPDSSQDSCADMAALLDEVAADGATERERQIEHRLAHYLVSIDMSIADAAKLLDVAMGRTPAT